MIVQNQQLTEDIKYQQYTKDKEHATIQTYSGLLVAPFSITEEQIKLVDIAHALSNKCRFTGHTSEFYSVGQHSILVGRTAEKLARFHSAKIRNIIRGWGTLHDGDEAYTPDLPTPLKVLTEFVLLKQLGVEIRMKIMKKFGFPLEEPDEVQQADKILLATEKRDLMVQVTNVWGVSLPPPLEKRIVPMTPRQAKRAFLKELELINCL
jgi:hypothetical protein